jgi:hypothetical protein
MALPLLIFGRSEPAIQGALDRATGHHADEMSGVLDRRVDVAHDFDAVGGVLDGQSDRVGVEHASFECAFGPGGTPRGGGDAGQRDPGDSARSASVDGETDTGRGDGIARGPAESALAELPRARPPALASGQGGPAPPRKQTQVSTGMSRSAVKFLLFRMPEMPATQWQPNAINRARKKS